MAWKTQVVDRVPTYAGRVKLTAVSGQPDVYDLVRADSPIVEGTPINAALLNAKADCLLDSVTVYVSKNGSDVSGTGASTAPFATIQAAVNALPKNLCGFHAQIDIGEGTYDERVQINGFTGGRLTLGVADRLVTVRGIAVTSSAVVELRISNITHSNSFSETLLCADYGSNVSVLSSLTISGESATVSGVSATGGSVINATDVTLVLQKFGKTAVIADSGAVIALGSVSGSDNAAGLRAENGGVIAYATKNMSSVAGDSTSTGGRIFTGASGSGGSGGGLVIAEVVA